MNTNSKAFLMAILGADGYRILAKAALQYPEISTVILPKAVVSWLDTAQAHGYDGEIPGIEGSVANLSKSECKLTVSSGEYVSGVSQEDMTRLAAVILATLDETAKIPDSVDLQKTSNMSKSLELLVKSKTTAWLNSSAKEDLEKAGKELPGKPAAPRAAIPPLAPGQTPQEPTSQKKRRSGVFGLPKLPAKTPQPPAATNTFGKSELAAACKTCGQSQIHARWGTFGGCACLSDMLKSEEVEIAFDPSDESYTLLGSDRFLELVGKLVKQ